MSTLARPSFAAALRDALGGESAREAWHLVALPEVTSTQDEALRVAAECGPLRGRWLVVRAERQTAGRGRGGKAWLDAPGGSLLVTVGVELSAPTDRWPLASLVAGAALASALQAAMTTAIVMKWPNDLLVVRDGAWRKLGGCLAERRERPGSPPLWLFGFGINLDRAAFAPAIAQDLGAVRDAVDHVGDGDDVDAATLLAALLRSLRLALHDWQARAWQLDTAALNTQLAFVGDEVTLALDDLGGVATGRLLGLDDDGRLRVADALGRSQSWLPLSLLDAKSTPPWHAPQPRMRT